MRKPDGHARGAGVPVNSREHQERCMTNTSSGAYSLRTRSKERNPANLKGPAESL
jgi:hypothetical protein